MPKKEPYELAPEVVAAQAEYDRYVAEADAASAAFSKATEGKDPNPKDDKNTPGLTRLRELRDARNALRNAARLRFEAVLRKAAAKHLVDKGETNHEQPDGTDWWQGEHDRKQAAVPGALAVIAKHTPSPKGN